MKVMYMIIVILNNYIILYIYSRYIYKAIKFYLISRKKLYYVLLKNICKNFYIHIS